MAFFGSTNAFLGIDIGTSNIKIVELIDRKRRVEVATYAQANMPNPLISVSGNGEDAVRKVVNVLSRMLDTAGVSSDMAVAALPSTIVFSTVLTMPNLADEEMEKAVHFAARDVVPSDLDEMVLGWSRLVSEPHMDTDAKTTDVAKKQPEAPFVVDKVPVFLTAAPKVLVDRYLQALTMLKLRVHALEVETFPLARSLLSGATDSALMVDIGDLATTYHVIDKGTPRVSHTIDYGGNSISRAIADALLTSIEDAEAKKIQHGLSQDAPEEIRLIMQRAVKEQVDKAKILLRLYQQKEGRAINKSILIGGGANLRGLQQYWSTAVGHSTVIGNPWKGLAYPQELEPRLQLLGPTYGVAVGLALRGLQKNNA